MLQETHVRPNTGLQSFAEASPDYMLAPVGLGSFQRQAQKLAEYGRNGDIYVVHAAEGETVIPVEVLDANPKVRALLFNQMREMGMDPNEYVVGDELNSINPATGLPEFFFKSVFKSIGKAAKKVFKVAKKVAPIVLPLALSAFGVPFLGTAFPALFGQASIGAAFLGSGIGTLIGGGGIKDALKSGLMSAATIGLTKGLYSAASPGGFSLDSLKGTPSTWGQLGSVVSGNTPASSLIPDLNAPKDYGWFESVPPVPAAAPVVTSTPMGFGLGDVSGGGVTTAPMGFGPDDVSNVAPVPSRVAPRANLYDSPGKLWDPTEYRYGDVPMGLDAPLAAGPGGVSNVPMGISPGAVSNAPMGFGPGDVSNVAPFPSRVAPTADLYGGPNVRDPNDFRDIMRLDAPLAAGPRGVSPIPGDELNIIDPMDLENDLIFMSRKDGSITGRPGSYDVAYDPDISMSDATEVGGWSGKLDPEGTLLADAKGKSLQLAESRLDLLRSKLDPEPEWYEVWKSPKTFTMGEIEQGAVEHGINIRNIPEKDIKTWLKATNPGPLERNRLLLAGLGAAGYGFRGELFGGDDEDPELSEAQQAQMNAARENELWYVADLPQEEGETPEAYDTRNRQNKWEKRKERGYIMGGIPSPYTPLVASGGLIQSGARGGFPRRELLIEGPGTGRSDDIPAMLSDGEFVMNASAVRGADPTGRGNRHAGARNLYNIMRNFEMRA